MAVFYIYIYILENFRTLDEISKIIDEHSILLHSNISSSLMETLNIEHISHSIIIEHLINSISILNKSERNLNLNSHLNYKEHLSWLVSTGAWQPEEKDMPNHNPGVDLSSLLHQHH